MKIEKLDVAVVLAMLALVAVYLRLDNLSFLYAAAVLLVPWLFFLVRDSGLTGGKKVHKEHAESDAEEKK
jgi:hypothetical protein